MIANTYKLPNIASDCHCKN